jgi:Zn-dependent M28 family amino/carboxypeptidase
MKLKLLIPLALLAACQTVKQANGTKSTDALLTDVKTLSSESYTGRKTGTAGAEMARTYLKKRLKNLKLSSYPNFSGFEQPFTATDKNNKKVGASNLIAYIPGKSQEVIVISGHYDHLGVINNEVYNGADDNASGVAAMLHIAAFYQKQQPNHTLVFAFFDAGELDWQGSKYFVDHAPFPLKNILLNVNLDMISHNDKGELYAAGTYKNPALKNYLTHTNPNVKIMLGHDNPAFKIDDWTNQSDQGAFHAKNIPFLYFGVEDHTDYHKATDEFENLNQAFFLDATNVILQIIDNLDNDRDIQAIFREKLQMKKQ